MRSLVLFAVGAVLGVAPAADAVAQSGPPASAPSAQYGLRYLSWPGKPARPTAPAARSAPAARPTPTATPPAPPSPVPPAPAAQSTYGLVAPSPYAPERRGLTPATMMPVGPADPRAPRADAPIFHMAQPAAAPIAPPAPAPAPVRTAAASTPPPAPAPDRAGDSPRYYSVHRQAGQDPDPIPLPAPFFLDSAPVDLAEPPPPPAIIRNGAGMVASVPEPDLP